jgi:hypothetical protein
MAIFGKASMGKDEAMSAHVVIKGRWCLTEDGKLVPEGDPNARWLWGVDGQEIPDAECKKVGYGEAKMGPVAENKIRRPSSLRGNKGVE